MCNINPCIECILSKRHLAIYCFILNDFVCSLRGYLVLWLLLNGYILGSAILGQYSLFLSLSLSVVEQSCYAYTILL